jgi:Asp-tRNA(Asn)/Glu-tRNA(Gln) amidotransferase A subunit family amidase
LKEDRLTLEEYYQDVIDRIEDRDGLVQALLPEEGRRERLFESARELRERYTPEERPPLYGALFGVKDIFKLAGFGMRAGSRLPESAFEGPEAAIVSRLRELGAVPLGQTVTTEFAYFSPGPTTNPRNPHHTPGGSSSGSAAAVGAGYCRIALGTQTIGSIVRPAAFCGISGVKPSYETLPRDGVFPFSESADHVGFLLGSAADGLTLMGILLDGAPWNAELGEELRFAVPDDAYVSQVEAAALEHFRAITEAIRQSGAQLLQSGVLSDIGKIAVAHREMIAREFFKNHEALFHPHGNLYSESSVSLFQEGKGVSQDQLEAAREGRLALRSALDGELDRLDAVAWLSPSSFSTAPKGLTSTGSPAMNLPWTYAGVPAVNVPSGVDDEGLPFGLQIAGRFGADRETLAVAARLERLLSQKTAQ